MKARAVSRRSYSRYFYKSSNRAARMNFIMGRRGGIKL